MSAPPSPARSAFSIEENDRSDIDSIWNFDFEESWDQRRREAAASVEELKKSAPHLVVGFAVTPGQTMSRRPSRNTPSGEKRTPAGSGYNSRVVSSADLGQAETATIATQANEEKGFWGRVARSRRIMRGVLRLKRFHLVMIGLVAFDLIIVMVELIIALLTAGCTTEENYIWLEQAIVASHRSVHPSDFACTLAPTHHREMLEDSIFGVNVGLLSLFTIEVILSIYAFGPITYCTSWVSVLDGLVVLTTLVVDIFFHISKDPAAKSPVALVILRLWKVFRAVHAIAHALELHYHEVLEAAEEGRDKLEWERISESIRLGYVRRELIRATGSDVDPLLVEDEVKREVAILRRRRAEEEDAAVSETDDTNFLRAKLRRLFRRVAL